jgi:drug/metabolite transporter (DMT)-like permease
VEAGVAAAVLGASLLHAAWHALVKSSGDRVVALAGMNLVSGTVALALVPFVALPPAPVMAVIMVSVLVHGAYKLALATLYSGAELSRAYPLARGITPIMAMALGFALLGDRPGAVALAGILVVSAGVLGLLFERSAVRLSPLKLGAAVGSGTAVAVYSVIDAYGVRLTGDWLGFTAWLVACDSCAFVVYAIATRRREAFRIWRSRWGRTLVSGMLGSVSFGIFMWALSRAQVGAVAALRETSILFAALIGVALLKERMTPARGVSAALVTLGVAALAWFG